MDKGWLPSEVETLSLPELLKMNALLDMRADYDMAMDDYYEEKYKPKD